MTDAELAILSIVAEGPIYGYDIQTVIAERGLRAWTNIGSSSMYYVLEKLERQGLIASTSTARADDTARRQYRITTAGYGVLQTSVADLISTPREYGASFELGLANLHVLRPEQIRAAFTAYQQDLVSRIGQVRERLANLSTGDAPFNITAMLNHHHALLEAELHWIAAFIEKWEAQAPPDTPPAPPPEMVEVPRMKQVILPHDPDSLHRARTRPHQAQQDAQLASTEDTGDDVSSASQTTLISASTPTGVAAESLPPDEINEDSIEKSDSDESNGEPIDTET
jgi:DNA-binding PadR family transcriptional regulator